MNPWWAWRAAEVHPPDPNEEGGPIYPEYDQGNGTQAARSAYSGRQYNPETPEPQYPLRSQTREQIAEEAAHAKLLSELIYYMLVKMEPTDRCLRRPGDIFDYKRLCSECGLEHGDKPCGH